MPTAEVVGRPDQPHARLQRPPARSRRPGPSRQRGQPGAQGGLKPLDVGGVDHRAFAPLRTDETSLDRLFSAAHYTPKNPDHPSPSVALDRLGDHEAFWQKESRTPSLAGAKRLAKHLERLLRVTGQPIGAKQKGLESATGAHTFEQRANQPAVAPYLHYAAEPQPATNRKRRGQPHDPTDDPHPQLVGLDLRQEHPSGLHDVLVEASALPAAHQLPAIDGAFVQTESRNDGLGRAAVGQQGYDGRDEGVGLVHPVERRALGGRKGLGAPFAAVALLFFAVDYDVSFSRSSVGPAAFVMAKSLLRVHEHLLLLTSDTSKGAAGPAFFQLIPHPRLRGVLPKTKPSKPLKKPSEAASYRTRPTKQNRTPSSPSPPCFQRASRRSSR